MKERKKCKAPKFSNVKECSMKKMLNVFLQFANETNNVKAKIK
jgi:hypothetical protein